MLTLLIFKLSEKRKRTWERERERERERENSNSKTLFYKDCSLGSVKRERESTSTKGEINRCLQWLNLERTSLAFIYIYILWPAPQHNYLFSPRCFAPVGYQAGASMILVQHAQLSSFADQWGGLMTCVRFSERATGRQKRSQMCQWKHLRFWLRALFTSFSRSRLLFCFLCRNLKREYTRTRRFVCALRIRYFTLTRCVTVTGHFTLEQCPFLCVTCSNLVCLPGHSFRFTSSLSPTVNVFKCRQPASSKSLWQCVCVCVCVCGPQ